MFGFVKKILGTAQTRLLKRYSKIVSQVNAWDAQFQFLNAEELRQKTEEFKDRYRKGETLDQLLPEAYAIVKCACRLLCGTDVHVSGYNQKWDMIPYDVQILGAIAMHFGAISEMQTGEGKTLTASMPLYLNALSGKPVHLVTVNDYLAQRDCEWIGSIFRFLGLSVRALTHDIPPNERKDIYASDIVYGTASEFGFDYLRDNSMVMSANDQCQRGHFFAIVDEIDSILIDEARTPLIISGPSSSSQQMYDELKDDVADLVRLQRDLCNRLAGEARKTLEKLGRLDSEAAKEKLSKEQDNEEREALKKLWLISKGMPHNKVLKRIKEDPDLRAELDKLDTYFYSEANKEERAQTLTGLYIIVDERSNEFELTDKGIHAWGSVYQKNSGSQDDFVMLDLGHEYALIEADPDLSEQAKLQKKVQLREEDAKRKERAHNLRQLLRAHLLMEKDVDYIVDADKIVIIDENTGRPQPGRRFSDGLHQAIEAKEGVSIQGETQTYATITLQNYFRMYEKLAGMTGTAMTEANEFKEIYKLDVLAIPTHRPCKRMDAHDEIYMTEREKYNAILKEILEVHGTGRPILVGTESVDISEKLSRILKQNKLEHNVLNAKNHAREAEIIAGAGERGGITVATNMAGRGTDIKLQAGIAEIGGLHVIGTTRHQSRRIDRQLRGRCARQGDPGSSKFYVSFEDSLMRLFTSPRITAFLQRFRPAEGEPISAKPLNAAIETAQQRIEQRNFSMRKHTLEYDDVMNKQRAEIYSFRNEVLHSDDTISIAEEILQSLCSDVAHSSLSIPSIAGHSQAQSFGEWLTTNFPIHLDKSELERSSYEDLSKLAAERVIEAFRQKIRIEKEAVQQLHVAVFPENQEVPPQNILIEVIRNILIRSIDRLWQEHLLHIDHLRSEVHLRTIGQKDPLVEFKHEAFSLFSNLSLHIKEEIAHALFRFSIVAPKAQQAPQNIPQEPNPQAKGKLFRFNLSSLS